MELLEYIDSLISKQETQKITEKEEAETVENERLKKEKDRLEREQLKEQARQARELAKKAKLEAKNQPKKTGVEDFTTNSNPFPDYRPPDWETISIDGKELTYSEVSKYYDKNLRYKKIELLSDLELKILKNVRILKDCYCTSGPELQLAKFFLGKFDFDPFSNPYAKTSSEKYAVEDFIFLDGHSSEKDGFNLGNWPLDRKSIFVNPPFSKLPKASEICNIVSRRDAKPGIALVGNLDYNNYVKESFLYADYCVLLGRVQYKPMVGLTVSSPRWNSILTIYNSKVNLEGSCKLLLDDKEYYVIDLRNKKIINIKQLELPI